MHHLQSTRPVLGVLVLPGSLLQRPRHPGRRSHDVQSNHAVGLVRERAVNGLQRTKRDRNYKICMVTSDVSVALGGD